MGSKIGRIKRELKLHNLEGSTAIKKLCRLIEDVVGTEDPLRFGQHEHGSYGVLIHFLEENSGAAEALINFLEENYDQDEPEEEEKEPSLIQSLLEEEPEEFLCRPYFMDGIQCLGVETAKSGQSNLLGKVVAFLSRKTTDECRDEMAEALERMTFVKRQVSGEDFVYFPTIEYVGEES